MNKSYKELMNDISTFIFDVDGVLTNGNLQILSDGQLLRTMNIKDGYAMRNAIDNGYRICIISGGKNQGVGQRLKGLGITDIFLGVHNKIEIFENYIKEHKIDTNHVLYMGDDIPDLKVMQRVALACCPQDAAPEIKKISRYISHIKGGEGAVRDVIEQVMKVHGKWISENSNQ